jgi:hypothetical protein
MVYDYINNSPVREYEERGYTIHDANPQASPTASGPRYELYTDDGRGNGDYIAGSDDIYWIRRIADALDQTDAQDYDSNGNRK